MKDIGKGSEIRKGRENAFNKLIFSIVLIATAVLSIAIANAATPEGPTVTYVSNSTRAVNASAIVNITGGASLNTSGGYIFAINLNAFQTNSRWKAYYGNVTGTLTLDDAAGSTIYRWPISSTLTGNVYATRSATTVTWASINCASVAQIETENNAISHTNPNDNITQTFNSTNHTSFTVAGATLSNCRSTSTFVNDNPQNQSYNDTFPEIVAYDGTSIVYATRIETNKNNYATVPSDFQLLLPENGLANWASSIAYYFYVELQ